MNWSRISREWKHIQTSSTSKSVGSHTHTHTRSILMRCRSFLATLFSCRFTILSIVASAIIIFRWNSKRQTRHDNNNQKTKTKQNKFSKKKTIYKSKIDINIYKSFVYFAVVVGTWSNNCVCLASHYQSTHQPIDRTTNQPNSKLSQLALLAFASFALTCSHETYSSARSRCFSQQFAYYPVRKFMRLLCVYVCGKRRQKWTRYVLFFSFFSICFLIFSLDFFVHIASSQTQTNSAHICSNIRWFFIGTVSGTYIGLIYSLFFFCFIPFLQLLLTYYVFNSVKCWLAIKPLSKNWKRISKRPKTKKIIIVQI